MATKKGIAKAKTELNEVQRVPAERVPLGLGWSRFQGKRGVEAWWGFLAGALIVIAVVIFLLIWYVKVKNVSLGSVSSIGDKLGNIFK